MHQNRNQRRRRILVVLAVASATIAVSASAASASIRARVDRDSGVLTIVGDARGGTLIVSRDRRGLIEVNGGTVPIHGARATVTNVARIVVLGGAGDDRIALDEADGPLPRAVLRGGTGDDELFGGSGNDRLFGGSGRDTLLGGAGHDRLSGGAARDQLIWNPGDGSDLDEGGDGSDSVIVNGDTVGEAFTAAPDGTRVRFDRISPAPFTLDIGTTEHLVVNTGEGDDSFAASGDLAPLIHLRVDGGAGHDQITGSNGDDTLVGGPGDDTVDGRQGADLASLGDGNDTFVWENGDGSDVVDGRSGQDSLIVNGAASAESFDLSADGAHARLSRDLGQIDMDLTGIEQVDANPLGGADTFTVNDLSGTDVTAVDIGLAPAPHVKAGDGAPDHVIVNGTDAADSVTIDGSPADGVAVQGLAARVDVFETDGSADGLTVNALAGDDTVNATGLAVGAVSLTVNGGAGTDDLSGGPGTVLVQ